MNNFFKSPFGKSIVYFFLLHLFLLFIFFFYRGLFIYTNASNYTDLSDYLSALFTILASSFLFDNSIIVVTNLIPFLLISFLGGLGITNRKFFIINNVYIFLIYAFIFALCCSNIPYFSYFHHHIDSSIFNWKDDTSVVISMLAENKSYIGFFIMYILSIVLLAFFLYFSTPRVKRNYKLNKNKKAIVTSCFILLLYLLPAYYSIFPKYNDVLHKRRTLIINDSYGVTDYIFLNYSIINGFFNLYTNIKKMPPSSPLYTTVDQNQVIRMIKNNLNFNINDNEYLLPNSRKEDSIKNKPNIVILLVESFSNDYLSKKEDNGRNLMPFMNSLKNKSYYFSNFYSQGTHTNQGIVSTLFSFPALFERHMLRNVSVAIRAAIINEKDTKSGVSYQKAPAYQGLPQDLSSLGYQTIYFMTHEKNFDNEGYSLQKNGFNMIFGQEDYPTDNVQDLWGISDRNLFKYVENKIESISENKQPFFVTIQTIANHIPYTIDNSGYDKISNYPDYNAMAYEDKQLELFFKTVSTTEWFNNTIFVILGDHGKVIEGNNDYYVSLSLNHIPMFIYSPLFNDHRQIDDLGGQIDIYPTIMGLLGIETEYKSFGIDLFKNKRKYIFYTTDEKFACLSSDYLYVYDTNSKQEYLTKWDNLANNIIETNKSIASEMKSYSGSMIDGAKYILNKDLIDEDITK